MTDDKELIARLRSMHWCVTTKANGVGVSDGAVAPEAADRMEALSDLNKKLTLKVSHYSDLLYDQLGTPCEQIRHKQEIEALEAKLAKAVEGLYAVVQHEASTFFGSDGEKNKRASWRGVMRKVRATLAEIKAT